jgi:hypothetical protein
MQLQDSPLLMLTFLIGSGWGRDTWGSFGWGDKLFCSSAEEVMVFKQICITGDEDAFTDITVAVSD